MKWLSDVSWLSDMKLLSDVSWLSDVRWLLPQVAAWPGLGITEISSGIAVLSPRLLHTCPPVTPADHTADDKWKIYIRTFSDRNS